MILLSAPADYMTPCNKVRSFLLKPENPEEGSNMFTFKKEKEEAMSEEEKKMAQELGDAIGNLEEAGLFYEEIEDSVELSPAEKLAYNIADHLAAVTAERFSDMIDGMDMDIAIDTCQISDCRFFRRGLRECSVMQFYLLYYRRVLSIRFHVCWSPCHNFG